MDERLAEFIKGSKIVNFILGFNKKALIAFCNSKIYKLFVKTNTFFRGTILKNTEDSLIINRIKKVISNISTRDIGIFIVLVVVFNTLAMVILKKEIDIFSISARIFFFILGLILYVRYSWICKKRR